MTTSLPAIEYPAHFLGIYERIRTQHAHLLEAAAATIRAMPISDDLRSALAYQTWDNPQPSFILLPLMFIATAEASGGITQRHVDYLPSLMLLSELLAVADDTVDRCIRRSGRDTYAYRFGDASALPFAATLTTLFLQGSHRADPAVFAAASAYCAKFFPLELWEREHTFPEPELFAAWLDHRYNQSIWSTQFVLDSALLLNHQPTLPESVAAALSRIGQDVDDIVNVVEFRETEGENDDLMCGVVTRPMVLAITARPMLAARVAALWQHHRPLAREQLSIAAYQDRRRSLVHDTMRDYIPIRGEILEHGVPATVRAAHVDLQICTDESPDALRPVMHGLAMAFLDRLRACKLAEVTL
jgi:hypothetical protein